MRVWPSGETAKDSRKGGPSVFRSCCGDAVGGGAGVGVSGAVEAVRGRRAAVQGRTAEGKRAGGTPAVRNGGGVRVEGGAWGGVAAWAREADCRSLAVLGMTREERGASQRNRLEASAGAQAGMPVLLEGKCVEQVKGAGPAKTTGTQTARWRPAVPKTGNTAGEKNSVARCAEYFRLLLRAAWGTGRNACAT